jgi:hypothetical protein
MAAVDTHDELVPDPVVWRELGITPMTGWRWTHDPALEFPPAVKIRNRNYRSRAALNAWRERMFRRALPQTAVERET